MEPPEQLSKVRAYVEGRRRHLEGAENLDEHWMGRWREVDTMWELLKHLGVIPDEARSTPDKE